MWAGDILSAGMIKFKQDYFRFGKMNICQFEC